MSPILVRPVREQFEHDRIIRLLQARYRRKYDVAINPGAEQNASVTTGDYAMYPDLVLFSQDRGRKLQGTVEVETGESVNTLEAMAEWGPFSRLHAAFFLYVPPHVLDTARRLCAEHQVVVSEIWTYHAAGDQIRFTMVHRAPEAEQVKPRPERPAQKPPAARRVAARKPAAKPVRAAKSPAKASPKKTNAARSPKPARAARPVRKAARAKRR